MKLDMPGRADMMPATPRTDGSLRQSLSRAREALKSYLDPRQVGYLILYVTNRCNFRCPFCFYIAEIDKGAKPDELTLDELRRVARRIGPLLQLSLTGGEPFLRKDLAGITAAFAEDAHVRYLTVPTNASLTEVMVRYLESVLPAFPETYFRIVFSIEAIGEAHDEIRAMPGSYAKIEDSFRALAPLRRRFANLVVDANSVYTARTEGTLLATLETLSRDFDFDNLSVTYARGEVRDPALLKVSQDAYMRINAFLEGLRRKKERRFLYPLWRGVRDASRQALIRTVFDDEFVSPCVAGRKLVILGETGEVYPCEILDRPMGNVRDADYDINVLLAREENRELRHWIVDTKCKCSFECALAANVVWNFRSYPGLLKAALGNIGRD